MPLDSSIPLSVKPQPFNNPFEILAQMQQLQGQRQVINSNKALEDERRQKIDAQAREEQAQQRFYAIIAASRTPDEAEARIQAEVPELLASFKKQRMELDKVASDIAADKLRAEELKANIAKKGQDYAEPFLQMVEKSNYDPKVFEFALGTIQSHFPDFPADQLRQRAAAGPEAIQQIIAGFKSPQQQQADTAAQKAAEGPPAAGFSLSPGQTRFDPAGQPIASLPEVPKPAGEPGSIDAAILAARNNPQELNRLLKLKRQASEAGREPSVVGSDKEPLVAIMGPDGKPVLVKRSAAEGKTPATTREQGRQVTSGDAGRIADIDTSLDNLNTLEQEVGKTGAGSWLGSYVPNPITEYTGVGAESKARQGVIDRVKQMIGKALEGGVLRKEDEIKYTKILPTIGDPPEVAKAKLLGLRELLQQKKQNILDALKDANYDVTQFEKRATAPNPATKPKSAKELIEQYSK